MHFEKLNVMTNDKGLVIDVIEKRLTEKNISYVKLDYDGYTEFHFLNHIYRFNFINLEQVENGKYEILNKVFNSINEDSFCIKNNKNDTLTETTKGNNGYKKRRKDEYKNFNNKKVNVKSKCKSIFYRR